jgi:hypothetical protein
MKTKVKILWSKKSGQEVEPQKNHQSNIAEPKPKTDNFDGTLKLQTLSLADLDAPNKSKPSNHTVTYLSSLGAPPEGMTKKEWEEKICCERLVKLFQDRMLNRYGVNVSIITIADRSCFKHFYRYMQDLRLTEELMSYIIEEWSGIKARYRLPYNTPIPRTFANSDFIKQIAIEFHTKKHVVQHSPTTTTTYMSDFDDERTQSSYDSDWESV